MRLWYLSHRRPAKAQVNLHIHAASPEPLLFAHIKYEKRRRVWSMFEECVYREQKVS